MVCYDVTNLKGFQEVASFLLDSKTSISSRSFTYLLGLKADLEDTRAVDYESGNVLAMEYGMTFLEVSAKDSQRLKFCAEKILHEIIRDIQVKDTLKRTFASSRINDLLVVQAKNITVLDQTDIPWKNYIYCQFAYDTQIAKTEYVTLDQEVTGWSHNYFVFRKDRSVGNTNNAEVTLLRKGYLGTTIYGSGQIDWASVPQNGKPTEVLVDIISPVLTKKGSPASSARKLVAQLRLVVRRGPILTEAYSHAISIVLHHQQFHRLSIESVLKAGFTVDTLLGCTPHIPALLKETQHAYKAFLSHMQAIRKEYPFSGQTLTSDDFTFDDETKDFNLDPRKMKDLNRKVVEEFINPLSSTPFYRIYSQDSDFLRSQKKALVQHGMFSVGKLLDNVVYTSLVNFVKKHPTCASYPTFVDWTTQMLQNQCTMLRSPQSRHLHLFNLSLGMVSQVSQVSDLVAKISSKYRLHSAENTELTHQLVANNTILEVSFPTVEDAFISLGDVQEALLERGLNEVGISFGDSTSVNTGIDGAVFVQQVKICGPIFFPSSSPSPLSLSLSLPFLSTPISSSSSVEEKDNENPVFIDKTPLPTSSELQKIYYSFIRKSSSLHSSTQGSSLELFGGDDPTIWNAQTIHEPISPISSMEPLPLEYYALQKQEIDQEIVSKVSWSHIWKDALIFVTKNETELNQSNLQVKTAYTVHLLQDYLPTVSNSLSTDSIACIQVEQDFFAMVDLQKHSVTFIRAGSAFSPVQIPLLFPKKYVELQQNTDKLRRAFTSILKDSLRSIQSQEGSVQSEPPVYFQACKTTADDISKCISEVTVGSFV